MQKFSDEFGSRCRIKEKGKDDETEEDNNEKETKTKETSLFICSVCFSNETSQTRKRKKRKVHEEDRDERNEPKSKCSLKMGFLWYRLRLESGSSRSQESVVQSFF